MPSGSRERGTGAAKGVRSVIGSPLSAAGALRRPPFMAHPLRDLSRAGAWRTVLDLAAAPGDVDEAELVLRHPRAQVRTLLPDTPTRALTDLPTDRIERLTNLIGRYGPHGAEPAPALVAELSAALSRSRKAYRVRARPADLERGLAIGRLFVALIGAAALREEEIVWLASHQPPKKLAAELAAWCERHAPLSPTMTRLVRRIRASAPNSPILDRLAAWVTPSSEGFRDLALWENGARRVFEPEWRAAQARWRAGVRDEAADGAVLEGTIEDSANGDAVRRAMALHGEAARAVLDATWSVERDPVVRAILGAWVGRARTCWGSSNRAT